DSSGCRRVLCVRVAPARQALQVKQKTCESKFFFSFLAFPLFSNYGQTMLPPETAWGDRLLRRNLHHEGVLTRTEGAAGAAAGARLMRTRGRREIRRVGRPAHPGVAGRIYGDADAHVTLTAPQV